MGCFSWCVEGDSRDAYWDGEQFDVNMDYMMEEL